MRITLVTGIYPPEIGGPAQYAKNLRDIWISEGYKVDVKIFGRFQWIPWGIRHVVFMFYIIPTVLISDCVFTLDAFSSGVVLFVGKLFSKKVIFRTGGDALWEGYVERTGDLVLLSNFYKTKLNNLSIKEKIMFRLMRWTLQNLSAIIWSTEWQRDIFMKPYGLEKQKHCIIENYYGPRLVPQIPKTNNFIAATRPSRWKNIPMLQKVFSVLEIKSLGATLDINPVPHDVFLEKISSSYAVIVVSLGDISPNTILDAIRCQKPFIVTREVGIYDRIKDIAIFVDPQDEKNIQDAVIWLSDPIHYAEQVSKLQSYSFVHDWPEIASEYIEVFNSL